MAADPKQSETFRQIQEAFQSAQSQMTELRQQVEKDRALRQLGESVFKQVQKGKLQLPEGFGPFLKAVEHAQKKAEAHAREIGDLLKEGEEAAQRLNEKKAGPTNSGVASRKKPL